MNISEEEFQKLVSDAIDGIPKRYLDRLENVAFIVEDEPTPEQLRKLGMAPYQTLFGLYEGAPLPSRGGQLKMLPDKITLYKNPLAAASRDIDELRARVNNTIWHEVAHYYGLDHHKIHALESKPPRHSEN